MAIHDVNEAQQFFYRYYMNTLYLPTYITIASHFQLNELWRTSLGILITSTNSQGIGKFRSDVAHFLTARDGHVSKPWDIFLTNGASSQQ